jgi:hypothetical protein
MSSCGVSFARRRARLSVSRGRASGTRAPVPVPPGRPDGTDASGLRRGRATERDMRACPVPSPVIERDMRIGPRGVRACPLASAMMERDRPACPVASRMTERDRRVCPVALLVTERDTRICPQGHAGGSRGHAHRSRKLAPEATGHARRSRELAPESSGHARQSCTFARDRRGTCPADRFVRASLLEMDTRRTGAGLPSLGLTVSMAHRASGQPRGGAPRHAAARDRR